MDGLTVFNYNGMDVRTVEKAGDPWWVLGDVCNALGLAAPQRVATRLDDDEKSRHKMNTGGGDQDLIIINEPGLYSVILRSNKPEAKQFKRWVTHEVIPTIRKTGQYGVGRAVDGIEALTKEVRRLTEIIDSWGDQAQPEPGFRSPGAQATFSAEQRRKWMRSFNARLELLMDVMPYPRNTILHMLYETLERDTHICLDNERIECMERRHMEDCSIVDAIYFNDTLREHCVFLMDGVLEMKKKERSKRG